MAVVSIATLKSYFNTGDVPTESQYVDLIDTLASLSAILGVSGNTGGNNITSPDGNTTLSVADTFASMIYTLAGITAIASATFEGSELLFDDNGAGGSLNVNAIRSRLYHSALIQLDAPVINIAQIPTSSAGLSVGDIWSDNGVLTIV